MIEGSSFVPGKTVSNSFAKMNISDILKKNNNNDMKKNFKNNFICLKKISPLYNLFYLLFFALPIFSMNLPVPDNEVVSEPLPESYKKILMSESDVEKFIEDALQNNKQPVFFFGANWCPDCRILDGTLELPTIKKYMQEKFEVLHIDVGRYDINMELMQYFQIMPQKGIPRVVILDKSKQPLNLADTGEWTTARQRSKQEIFDYFQKYTDE